MTVSQHAHPRENTNGRLGVLGYRRKHQRGSEAALM